MATAPEGYIVRFADGPLSQRAGGQLVVSPTLFGWPLPRRLYVLSHATAANIAMWDADAPVPDGLPPEITESPNRVIYVKTSESQLPKDIPGVLRGAEYRIEEATDA